MATHSKQECDVAYLNQLNFRRKSNKNYSKWTLNPKLHTNPSVSWDHLKVQKLRPVTPVAPVDPKNPQPKNTLRVVMISDTHNLHDKLVIPAGDVLVHAGDFTSTGRMGEVENFANFIAKQPHKHKLVIAGNHDLTFEPESYPKTSRFIGNHKEPYDCHTCIKMVTDVCTYLKNESVVIQGLKFYGSPYQPWFFDWAFNVARGPPCAKIWQNIPDDTDFLITHGPPIGHGDACSDGQRAGCVDLLKEIETRVRPLVHVFGHIHEGYGVTTNETQLFVNASSCTLRYQADNPAIVLDLPLPTTTTTTTTTMTDDMI